MSRRLLETHLDSQQDQERIERILDVLTEKLYYHGYPISRAEARDDVGLPVTFADDALEKDLWALHMSYATELRPGLPAIPPAPGALSGPTLIEVDAAIIESTHGLHTFRYMGTATPVPAKGTTPANVNAVLDMSWGRRT